MAIKYFAKHKTSDFALLRILVLPSWISGLVAVVIGVAITAGVIIAFSFSGSQFAAQLANWQETKVKAQPALTQIGEAPPTLTNTNSLQSNWPLLAIWGFIGLAVYYVAVEVIGVIRSTAELRAEMEYINAQRNSLLRETLAHLALRLSALAVWLLFTLLFFKQFIPDSIAAAHRSAIYTSTFYGLGQALVAFAIIAGSLHIHTIFLRLALRRPRVISASFIA